MEYSKNFNFALPSRDNDVDLADINEISNNFRKIDENSVKKEVGKGLSTNDFTDEYKIINAVENVKRHLSVEKRNKFARESMQNVIKNECAGKYVEKMLRFLDFDTIEERLKNYNTISLDFIGNVAGWCTATVLPSSYDSDGNLEEIII